jgi:hypothetical protein
MRLGASRLIALTSLICAVGGCHSKAAHGASAGARHQQKRSVQAGGLLFADPSHGFSLRYPSGWSKRQDSDKENVLVADSTANDPNGVELTVAVPDLGAHIPGFIPLGAVQSGYINDLKKRLKDVSVQESGAPKISGASGTRRFVVTGTSAKGERKLDVALLVKGDHLYILTAEAPVKDFAKAKAALDQALATWQWTGK